MDPNANLAEQQRILRARQPGSRTDAGRLQELRAALAQWLHAGGFEPTWDAYPTAARYWRAFRESRRRMAGRTA